MWFLSPRFESTYKELKPDKIIKACQTLLRFESTYKELKLQE